MNDTTAIDSILSQNSTNPMDPSFPSANTSKRTEKDEKAISEIYKTLVTSFNPGNNLEKRFSNRNIIDLCQKLFILNKKK